ncbi:DUF4298 domain-containing protein [Streptococcus acidominimus]|uniref:DUF4298 domain-containing protein n=2 Tax=Streptococcus acidominimus TaxID=1326 RepID=A0A380IA94_STRAI|nr:DUF4298 domain-containing protein [Streptococcus acidominimus]SUN04920.1 Uncharacterised protein [Streptococcus acidominimus]
MNDIKKIQKMEAVVNQAEAVLTALEGSLEAFEQFLPSLTSLIAYYESSDWMRHYEMDEAGELPQDMARGVLAEDTVYHLIWRYHELKQNMKKLGALKETNSK